MRHPALSPLTHEHHHALHHVRAEESELFPVIERLVPDDELLKFQR